MVKRRGSNRESRRLSFEPILYPILLQLYPSEAATGSGPVLALGIHPQSCDVSWILDDFFEKYHFLFAFYMQ